MTPRNKVLPALAIALLVAGCGPSTQERAAAEHTRLELEEKQRQEMVQANKAITSMTEKAFRQRTPEEEAQHRAEVAKQAQEILDAQKKAEATAATPPKP